MNRVLIVSVAALILFMTPEALRGGDWLQLYESGMNMFHAEDYDGAIEKFNQALQSAPDEAKIHIALGKTLFNLQRIEESRLAFEHALKLYPQSITAKLGLMLIDSATNRCDRALSALEQIKDLIDEIDDKKAAYRVQVGCDRSDIFKTIQRLTALITLEGDRAQVTDYLYLWQLYIQAEQPSHALEVIKKLLRLSNTIANRERYAYTLFKNGLVDESIAEYKALIREQPRTILFHLRLASALTAKEEYDEAKRQILTALSLDPKNADLHHAKAIVEFINKEYDQCIESSRLAMEAGNDEHNVEALFMAGECHYGKGEIEKALLKYEKLITKYPDSDMTPFLKEVIRNINDHRESEDRYYIDKVPFMKKKSRSSLSAAINMVLKYWGKKHYLTDKDIDAIEIDDYEPSLGAAWLLLKGKGFESVIADEKINLIKFLISARMPVIMRASSDTGYVVVTGYDERRQTFYYNDPKANNRIGQLIYPADSKKDEAILVIIPASAKDLLIKDDLAGEIYSPLYALTEFKVLMSTRDEKDYLAIQRISQLYPQIYEAKLLMGEIFFLRKDYKKAIDYYKQVLKVDDISVLASFVVYANLAASYANIGDTRKSYQYLKKANKIDSDIVQLYRQRMKVR